MRDVLSRFSQALQAEIDLLKEEERDRTYQLASGQREEGSGGPGGVYVFILADPMRLPEDASGTLRVGESDIRAMVVAQEGNRLWVLLESSEPLPPFISQARLVLSQTELLERLKERIDEMGGDVGMAPKVFGLENARVSWAPIPEGLVLEQSHSLELTLKQLLGSEVTFLWGPPGTGKTFTIAALVAALLESDESVLVTSHTHAGVEQALWAAVEPPSEDRPAGLLNGSEMIERGEILKVGPLRQEKIPKKCHLDSYLEEKAREQQGRLTALLSEDGVAGKQLERIAAQLGPWRELADGEAKLHEARSARERAAERIDNGQAELAAARVQVDAKIDAVRRAERSFFLGRKGRVAKAQGVATTTVSQMKRLETSLTDAELALPRLADSVDAAERAVELQRRATLSLQPNDQLETEEARLRAKKAELEAQIASLREQSSDWANELLEGARAVFATLTKLYMDPHLRSRQWDTVIIDEVSMAMLPLVAFAAARAGRRAIMVGDFYQLPPILQSRDGVAAEELRKDIFERRGIPEAVEKGENPPQLARLSLQRRMHPAIAEVARTLAYGNQLSDHPSLSGRGMPGWCGALGSTEPLVIVDTTDIRSWCGKMPGGRMSRFNFYSALAAVEIAAIYASQLPQPERASAPPIGIVTPYTAQRRYLAKLVEVLHLERWVAPGTVHTFQGSEYDVIIFDSVLGEPHWTARLTNPHEWLEVRRDLNVAVTRARHQFTFVGDSYWLDRRARSGSGYGRLWTHLKAAAEPLDVTEVLGHGFRGRVSAASSVLTGWNVETNPEGMTLLDETTFYPAFLRDLQAATRQVILFTPFIGKTRWPQIEQHIGALTERGVEVFVLHKPLTDPEWRRGDPSFGHVVFDALEAQGVHLVPLSGVHAKTIVIDERIVYDGSLNWASQTSSYEHMWRAESKDLAVLVEKMLQLRSIMDPYSTATREESTCPNCGGPLIVVNQAQQSARYDDRQPLKLGCYRYSLDKNSCKGYLRRIDARAPLRSPPTCPKGQEMALSYTKTGRPWAWKCEHKTCRQIRWMKGDVETRPASHP